VVDLATKNKVRGEIALSVHLIGKTKEDIPTLQDKLKNLEGELNQLLAPTGIKSKITYTEPIVEAGSISKLILKEAVSDAINVYVRPFQMNFGVARSLNLPGGISTDGVHLPGAILIDSVAAGDSRDVADTLRHELGHYFALFHPCELAGPPVHDPLGTGCSNDNPMYPRNGFGEFTKDQVAVIYRHPLVKIYREGDR
jgi:hypothetical protein